MSSCRLANLKSHFNVVLNRMHLMQPCATVCHLKLFSLTAFRDCIFWCLLIRGWNSLKNERALVKKGAFGMSQWDGVLRNVTGNVV